MFLHITAAVVVAAVAFVVGTVFLCPGCCSFICLLLLCCRCCSFCRCSRSCRCFAVFVDFVVPVAAAVVDVVAVAAAVVDVVQF